MAAPVLNRQGVKFTTVTVVTAGTPVQGPDMTIPHGFALAIEQRAHGVNRTGYVGSSAANVIVSGTRKEFRDGVGITLYITNANLLYFDASADATVFELWAEQ